MALETHRLAQFRTRQREAGRPVERSHGAIQRVVQKLKILTVTVEQCDDTLISFARLQPARPILQARLTTFRHQSLR
jgi:hypothetical protein